MSYSWCLGHFVAPILIFLLQWKKFGIFLERDPRAIQVPIRVSPSTPRDAKFWGLREQSTFCRCLWGTQFICHASQRGQQGRVSSCAICHQRLRVGVFFNLQVQLLYASVTQLEKSKILIQTLYGNSLIRCKVRIKCSGSTGQRHFKR